jgi:hypothetical protein
MQVRRLQAPPARFARLSQSARYLGPVQEERMDRQSRSIAVAAGAAGFIIFMLIVGGAVDQLQSAILIGALVSSLAALHPQMAIVVTFVYLAIMGDVRRWLVTQAGVTTNDPLLLVGPAVVGVLLLTAVLRNRISLQTKTAKMIFLLSIVMVLEVFNPLQGGIVVGAAGGLFFLVPLLWFWIGQAFGSSQFLVTILNKIVVPLAVAASVMGLIQAFFGYFHYEVRWFHLMMESSIHPDIRPFAFFCSWAEYAAYVGVALVIILVPLFQGRVRIITALTPLFVFALIIQSVREAIFEAILALAVLWAIGGRSKAAMGGRLILALFVGGVLLVLAMTQLKEVEVSDAVKQSINHTADGVLDIQNSSAGGHLDLVGEGFVHGFTHPIGSGLGYPTQAAGASGFSSEIDFADIFVACGFGGGLLYFYIIFLIFRAPVVHWRDHRDPAALYVLGIITLGLGHWLQGAAYAVSAITWFAIGSMDRIAMDAASLPTPARGIAVPRRAFRRPKLMNTPRPA